MHSHCSLALRLAYFQGLNFSTYVFDKDHAGCGSEMAMAGIPWVAMPSFCLLRKPSRAPARSRCSLHPSSFPPTLGSSKNKTWTKTREQRGAGNAQAWNCPNCILGWRPSPAWGGQGAGAATGSKADEKLWNQRPEAEGTRTELQAVRKGKGTN